ncbi:MAG: hypothetical protein PHF35_03950 [Candidatus Moranbacteria bacterium]|nr:hypothetical protein [Candidatus Moranbacteria bacterium]
MKNYPIFNASEVKAVFFDEKNILVQVAFWVKKGYLLKIKKGLYVLSSAESNIDPMLLAGKIYAPSYLSLEFALNYHGIIPDIPGTYTSVTSRKTAYFKNNFGNFSYQKIKPDLFSGYEPVQKGDIFFDIATPEKAILDYIYLNKNRLVAKGDFWKEMRINEEFKFSKKALALYEKLYDDKKIGKLVESLLSYQKNAR